MFIQKEYVEDDDKIYEELINIGFDNFAKSDDDFFKNLYETIKRTLEKYDCLKNKKNCKKDDEENEDNDENKDKKDKENDDKNKQENDEEKIIKEQLEHYKKIDHNIITVNSVVRCPIQAMLVLLEKSLEEFIYKLNNVEELKVKVKYKNSMTSSRRDGMILDKFFKDSMTKIFDEDNVVNDVSVSMNTNNNVEIISSLDSVVKFKNKTYVIELKTTKKKIRSIDELHKNIFTQIALKTLAIYSKMFNADYYVYILIYNYDKTDKTDFFILIFKKKELEKLYDKIIDTFDNVYINRRTDFCKYCDMRRACPFFKTNTFTINTIKREIFEKDLFNFMKVFNLKNDDYKNYAFLNTTLIYLITLFKDAHIMKIDDILINRTIEVLRRYNTRVRLFKLLEDEREFELFKKIVNSN